MSDVERIEGERTTSEVVSRRKTFSRKHKGVLILVGAVIFFAWIMWINGGSKKQKSEFVQPTKVGSLGDKLAYPPPPPAPPPPPDLQKATFQFPPMPPPPPIPATLAPQRQAAQPPKLLVYGGAQQPHDVQGGPAESSTGSEGAGGALASALKPTMIEGSMATMVPHPIMTIAEGTVIPCVLLTAIDSQLPGFVTCIVKNDVVGIEGNVTLLDAGTQVFGEVRSGDSVRSGQNRVFVLWRRARTPKGVIIRLASPATDSLGRSGIDGEVNNHWWAKFGDAVLFTLIESATQFASSEVARGGSSYVNLNSVASPATQTLQQTANIPPTITVHQGDTVGIMVARYLDFSGVYGLTMRSGYTGR